MQIFSNYFAFLGSILLYPAKIVQVVIHEMIQDRIQDDDTRTYKMRSQIVMTFLQFCTESCKIYAKTLIFIETMQINLHMSKYFCTFARWMRAEGI